MGIQETDPLAQLSLPPGFRFYPTDEELLVQYLCKKVAGHDFSLPIIAEIDLYKFDPWCLPSKAIFGEKEWYFFSPRDRKYPNGSRPNRVAGTGYWKATGTDKVITTEGRKVGIKKALVFYVGKAPKGTKTNWIMHEYRLSQPFTRKKGGARLDDWVLCRIYKKNSSGQKPICDHAGSLLNKEHSHGSSTSSSSQFDDVLESLPEIDERCFSLPRINSLKTFINQDHDQKLNLQSFNSGSFDWASLAALNSVPEPVTQPGQNQQPNMNNNNNTMNHHQNDMFMASTVPQIFQGGVLDEEVQSGIRAQRVNNPSLMFNSNAFSQGFSNPLDPFAIRFPTQQEIFGFRQ